jgi:hypothetical protein
MPSYSAVLQDDDIDALDQRTTREARQGSGVRIKKPGRRRRRDDNYGGQASWISSVINLVNTSMAYPSSRDSTDVMGWYTAEYEQCS